MNKEQYNSLPDDLKLDARLAITLGIRLFAEYCFVSHQWVMHKRLADGGTAPWQPRQDPAILWGMIDDYVLICRDYDVWLCKRHRPDFYTEAATKEEALIEAYCEADPHGHWAKWCKDNEVTA